MFTSNSVRGSLPETASEETAACGSLPMAAGRRLLSILLPILKLDEKLVVGASRLFILMSRGSLPEDMKDASGKGRTRVCV